MTNHPQRHDSTKPTVAVMAQNRFFLAVGTGERLNEQPFGERWPRTGERRERAEEAISMLRQLWEDKNVNERGEHWNIENLHAQTRPARWPPATSPRPAGSVRGWPVESAME